MEARQQELKPSPNQSPEQSEIVLNYIPTAEEFVRCCQIIDPEEEGCKIEEGGEPYLFVRVDKFFLGNILIENRGKDPQKTYRITGHLDNRYTIKLLEVLGTHFQSPYGSLGEVGPKEIRKLSDAFTPYGHAIDFKKLIIALCKQIEDKYEQVITEIDMPESIYLFSQGILNVNALVDQENKTLTLSQKELDAFPNQIGLKIWIQEAKNTEGWQIIIE
jgi:hypothetical protein